MRLMQIRGQLMTSAFDRNHSRDTASSAVDSDPDTDGI